MDFFNQKSLDKKYFTLLLDSCELLNISENIKISNYAKTCLYRNSIITAILSLECVADSCIFSLNLNKKFYKEIEKLGTIAKLNYFSLTINNKNIDYSIYYYQKISILIKIRNDYVHPKILKGNFITENSNITSDYGNYNTLNISKDIRKWNEIDVINVLESKIDFLNYYFIDLCNLDKGVVTNILTIREEKLNNENCFIVISNYIENLINSKLSIPIKYLDLRVQ